MQIVIDITEHNKNVIERFVCGNGLDDIPTRIIEDLILSVFNGIPLPKGHGRLIDADAVTKDFNTFQDSFVINMLDLGRGKISIGCTSPTIVEADKEN